MEQSYANQTSPVVKTRGNVITRLFEKLTRPHPLITDIETRRQSRLLAALTLTLLVTTVIANILLSAQDSANRPNFNPLHAGQALTLGLFFLNRSGRYRLSAYMFVAENFLLVHLGAIGLNDLSWLLFASMVLILSALLLPVAATLSLFAISILFQIAIGVTAPSSLIIHNTGLLVVFIVNASLILVFIRYRSGLERERQEELRELNQLKTEFISTAAHELRTPLTTILGFSEILLKRELDQGRQKHYLTLINQQSSGMSRIIDDLLDITRLEAQRKLQVRAEPVDIVSLTASILATMREVSATHQIEMQGFENCPQVISDSFRITQVIENLLSNAIKYSPDGSKVIVRGEVQPDQLQISIRDYGIGMTSDQQRHLFEKFYRADSSNTSIGGTGLGLAISKLIVELLGGRIWAESEYDSGTIVYFTLPLSGLGK